MKNKLSNPVYFVMGWIFKIFFKNFRLCFAANIFRIAEVVESGVLMLSSIRAQI